MGRWPKRDKPAALRIPKGHTKRTCMCCQKPFASEGIHNRLCNWCSKNAAGADQATYSVGRRV